MIDIIQKIARRYAVGQDVLDEFCASYNFTDVAALSPADVRAAFQTAHILALRSELRESTTSVPNAMIRIELSHLRQGFSQVRRSLSTKDMAYYVDMRNRFQGKPSSRSQMTGSGDQSEVIPLRTALK
jgi:hypothetical protein